MGGERREEDPILRRLIDRSLNYGREAIRRFLESASPYSTVLDLGAGAGSDLLLARRIEASAELHAIEVDPTKHGRLEGLDIRVHSSNLETDPLPFEDESLDIVIANQLLEHLKEIFWVMHQVTRCLRVGGRLLVGVPNLASLHNRLLLALGRQPTCLQNATAHVRGYTRRDLLDFLDSCFPGGYELRGFRGGNFYPFPRPLAVPLARAFPNAAWGIFLALEKKRPYDGGFLRFPVEERLETNFFIGDAWSTDHGGVPFEER